MHTLYLASGSPRRREILENLRFKVIRIPADIDETPHSDEKAGRAGLRAAAWQPCTSRRTNALTAPSH